ncbi:MAG TPA: MinD/ParA family protein [Candidatus Aquicultor sp.]|jgi:flagellar biosynthesis protein FlhG
MNDQAKKLRELAQRIREERDRINLIIDPMARRPEVEPIELNIPDIKELGGYPSTEPEPPAEKIVGPNQPIENIAETQPAVSTGATEPTARTRPELQVNIQRINTPIQPASPAAAIAPAFEPETVPVPKLQPEPEPENSLSHTMPKSTSSTLSPTAYGGKALSPTRVIAVSSGKGGVGKSNLVANLGIALAMRGRKTLILDADLGLANIDVIFGINPKFNLKHLVDGEKSLSEIVINGPHSLKIVPGGSGMPELADMGKERQQNLIDSFVELERDSDITLIDTGAGISNDVISFILAAREAIIITTPEPTAITDAYGLIKVLTQRDMDVDIKLVVNMTSTEKEGRDIADRIVMAAKQFLNKRVETLGYIVSDIAVNSAVRKQQPFILEFPGARASKCIRQIAATLDQTLLKDAQAGGHNGFRGFLSRLFER